jgi:hypothetical protein
MFTSPSPSRSIKREDEGDEEWPPRELKIDAVVATDNVTQTQALEMITGFLKSNQKSAMYNLNLQHRWNELCNAAQALTNTDNEYQSIQALREIALMGTTPTMHFEELDNDEAHDQAQYYSTPQTDRADVSTRTPASSSAQETALTKADNKKRKAEKKEAKKAKKEAKKRKRASSGSSS